MKPHKILVVDDEENILWVLKKGLEKNSKYNKYDINNDGVVTDEELAIATSIKETEQVLRKQLAQLRIARATLIAMGLFTVAMFFVDIERLKALSDISNLFYIFFVLIKHNRYK